MAGEPDDSAVAHQQSSTASLSDLTLSNLWSEGWSESWTKRSRGEGTPDMSLLRVQTNFLVQLFRVDSVLETGIESPTLREIR